MVLIDLNFDIVLIWIPDGFDTLVLQYTFIPLNVMHVHVRRGEWVMYHNSYHTHNHIEFIKVIILASAI